MANYVCVLFFACSFVGTFSGSTLLLFAKSNLVVEGAAQFSPKVLLRSDPRFGASISFAYLTVRASKTVQFQERHFFLPLPRIPGSLLCPAAALVNHLWINQVPQEMSLFSVRSAGSLHTLSIRFSFFSGKGPQNCRSSSYKLLSPG